MSNRLEFSPNNEENPEESSEELVDDSMQLKRDRLGVSDNVASQNISEESRLNYVDRLLKTAPMLSAPLGFADRVLARLKGVSPNQPPYQEGVGIALGLFVGVILAIPLFSVLAFVMLRAVVDGDYREVFLADVGDGAQAMGNFLVSLPTDYPILFVIAIVIVFIYMAFSGYIIWFWRGLRRSAKKFTENT